LKLKARLIARLDIKAPNLIKAVNLEGVRVVGDPQVYAKKYYESGIDEIIYMDAVASLYGRNNLSAVVSKTAENVFVPMTVGGGIRSLDDVDNLMMAGADKVAINSGAINNPALIEQIARKYGSQAVVISIEGKKIQNENKWEAYTDNGREKSGLDVLDWANQAVSLGAGEIILTSVDQEGTQRGFDIDLMKLITRNVSVPVIASGGMGNLEHAREVVLVGGANALAMAHVLHYNKVSISDVRKHLNSHGIEVMEHDNNPPL
jgi:imidazole glycerol-phosphate synthase subunit HisF